MGMKQVPTIKEMLEAPPLQCPVCDRPNYFPSDHHMLPKSCGGKTTELLQRKTKID